MSKNKELFDLMKSGNLKLAFILGESQGIEPYDLLDEYWKNNVRLNKTQCGIITNGYRLIRYLNQWYGPSQWDDSHEFTWDFETPNVKEYDYITREECWNDFIKAVLNE